MTRNHPQPRWYLLYLALPLAVGLFWAIHQAHPTGTVRALLEIGALLVVFSYVEGWHLASRAALLRHPLAGAPGQPIYHVREVVGPGRPGVGHEVRGVFVSDAYSALFDLPVQVGVPAGPGVPDGELSPAERAG